MVTIKVRKSFIIICGFIGIFLFIPCTQAQQVAAPTLDQRIDNQFKQIDRGVGLGHFSRDEERILLDNLDYIKHVETRFQSSGVFTMAEREQLHGLLNQNGQMIVRQRPVQTLRPARVGVDERLYYDGPYRIGGGSYYYYNGEFYVYDGGAFRFHHNVPRAEREHYEGLYSENREHYNRDYHGWRGQHPEHPWTSQREEDRRKAPSEVATTVTPARPATTVAPAKPVSETKPAKEMKAEKAAEPSAPAAKLPSGRKININAASKEELGALPGIGPVKAQAIIDGRPYKKTEDIMKVKGIKQGEFSEIKDLITVK